MNQIFSDQGGLCSCGVLVCETNYVSVVWLWYFSCREPPKKVNLVSTTSPGQFCDRKPARKMNLRPGAPRRWYGVHWRSQPQRSGRALPVGRSRPPGSAAWRAAEPGRLRELFSCEPPKARRRNSRPSPSTRWRNSRPIGFIRGLSLRAHTVIGNDKNDRVFLSDLIWIERLNYSVFQMLMRETIKVFKGLAYKEVFL